MSARAPLRAAVIGSGLMGRWHAAALRRAGGTVVAIADRDPSCAGALAARHPGARAVADLDAALAAGVDVVHICTPTPSHAALAERALTAGRHSIVEKPLAPDAAATAALLHLAETRGRLLCPAHQFLFQAGVLAAARRLPALGRPLHLDLTVCSAGAAGRPEDAQDGLVAEILPHPLALARRLLAAPLADLPWQVARPRPGELRATAVVGDATLSLLVSLHGRPTANALRLIAERGTIHADLFHGYALVEGGAASRARKVAHPFLLAASTLGAASANLARRAAAREPAYPGLRQLIAACYAAVRGVAPPPIAPTEVLDVAAARDALLRAMVRGGAGPHFPFSPPLPHAGEGLQTGSPLRNIEEITSHA